MKKLFQRIKEWWVNALPAKRKNKFDSIGGEKLGCINRGLDAGKSLRDVALDANISVNVVRAVRDARREHGRGKH
jgi:hypothetical protein